MPSYRADRKLNPIEQSRHVVAATAFGTRGPDPDRIAQLRTIVPFDQYAFSGVDYPGLGVGAGVMLASDMPVGFLSDFLEKRLIRFDPMNPRIAEDRPVVSWHELTPEELAQPDIARIRMLESHYNVSVRTIIGFYRDGVRYGGATFTRNTPFDANELLILEGVGRLIHTDLAARHLQLIANDTPVTEGERACLKAVAEGLSYEEAAATTGYSPDTIASYIKAAVKKLGCRNRTQAVVESYRRRLIR